MKKNFETVDGLQDLWNFDIHSLNTEKDLCLEKRKKERKLKKEPKDELLIPEVPE